MSSSSQNEEGNNGSRLVVHEAGAAPDLINNMYPTTRLITSGGGGAGRVKYMECLKNHAASMGGNATDGCGEFMARGEQGTLEALKRCACNCHRNFHHKIHMQQPSSNNNNDVAANDSASVLGHESGTLGVGKKRFRTKFSQEQKEKMSEFAAKCGWKLQRVDGSLVRSFGQEIGIKRKVLKVWYIARLLLHFGIEDTTKEICPLDRHTSEENLQHLRYVEEDELVRFWSCYSVPGTLVS